MKKHLLGSLLALGIITPFFANAAPSGWVLGQSVSSSNWISNAGCVSVINSSSCDYTGPSKALRLGYEYEFADEFWAGDRDRKLKNFCYEFKEPSSNGNYNQNKDGSGGENPTFNWTDELKNNVKEGVGYRVNKNTNMVILKANKIYQINAVPQTRSSDNLLVKYVVEYANDKAATTRYQHTECYPYEISRCGDGVVDKDWFKKNPNKPGEECDYKDPNKTGWEDGSGKRCNKSCELEEILPVCSSTYNNKTEYTSSSDQWLKATDNLCDEGSAVFFAYSGTPRVYKWKCKNGEKTTDDFCTAKQERCGDGVVQEDKEDCDDGENNGKSGSLCSKTCKTVGDVSCGTNDKGKTYFDEKQTKPWLTKTSAGMCGNGLTVGTPILTGSDSHIEWTCSNTNGTEKTCKAYQEYCGDGKKNGEEECDGTDFCDSQCKTITPATTCNEVFTGTRRLGDNKPFSDILKANWHDRYLFDKEVEFKENHGDYNNGDDPVFDWTDELVNNGMKVDANKEMTIIKSNPYNIITAPTIRASDNIYIEYTIRYDNVPHTTKPSKSNLYSHKECVYYEISRCGDGTLDKDYGEECDPGSAGTSTLPDGRICNKDCKIESTPQSDGKVKIEKTLKDKKEVSSTGEILTWDVKVWAEGGDVTDFQIKDIVPFALEYKSYKVNKNDDNLTVSDPTGPVKVDTGNVYTWDVKGTLKKDHELLLEVTTEVVLMPTSQDDYRNVACVINDGDEDCDDDKPGEGTRDIKKTLISPKEVTKVGDEIVWSLKLTVSGGVVKNPVITDILPPVLGYSGYLVTHNPGVTISKPTTGTLTSGGQTLEYVRWTTEGTLTNNDYIEIQLTTYVKEMPDEEYKNVLCVKPENEDEKCDDEPVYKPELWIKKTFTDGTKKKTVKIGDEIGYRIDFGNKGKASATVTSIKDFLPKNVKYKTGTIIVNSNSTYNTGTWEKGEEIVNGFNYIEGVRIEIYGGMTLEPNVSGYIILTGEVLNEFTGNTQNWACIYLDDKKIDCDDAIHEIGAPSCAPTLNPSSFSNVSCSDTSSFTTTVTCNSTGGVADLEIICNNEVINTGHAEQLTGTCSGTANNTDYKVQCRINGSLTGVNGEACEGSFRRNCSDDPCFPAGTKVLMADGTQKNIEDVEKGDIVLSYNTETNTNERSIVKQEIVHVDSIHEMYELTVNGEILKTTAVHPFYVRKSISSMDYAWIEAQNLKVGDILLMSDGNLVKIEKINHYNNKETVYNLEVEGNHDYFVDKGYLVHNKGGGSCFIAGTKVLMADGSEKNIEDVKIGEYIMGESGPNEVKGFDRPLLGDRNLWSINGSKPFVSDEHPFKTTNGWKAADREMAILEITSALAEGWLVKDETTKDLLNIEKLGVGDELIKRNNTTEVIRLLETGAAKNGANTQLYNFKLDGDNTYYANGYLVHNKGGGGGGGGGSSTPVCETIKVDSDGVVCKSTSAKAYFKLTCGSKSYYSFDYKDGKDKLRDYKFTECKNPTEAVCSVSKYDDKEGSWKTNSSCTKITQKPQECFNVNAGNFSIEEGEILPFYWNLFNIESWVKEKKSEGAYVEIKDKDYKGAPGLYDNPPSSCEESESGKIALNSMVCTFNIYHGGDNKNPLYSVVGPCLTDGNPLSEGLLNSWYTKMKKTYCENPNNNKQCYFSYNSNRNGNSALLNSAVYYIENFGKNASLSLDGKKWEGDWGLSYNSSKETNKPYGEYQIRLESIKYLQCNGDTWEQIADGGDSGFTPCESNFVLTNPYTVQKTPSGNLTASTEKLSKYKHLEGNGVFSDYINAIPTTSYNKNTQVEKAMDSFIKKYEKLAVKVNTDKFGKKVTVKKVPGKDIYFVDGEATFRQSGGTIKNAFTIIQTTGSTTINGDLKDYNMMLLTKGNIIFKGNCENVQTIKGIFYAGGKLIRDGVGKNVNIKNGVWCTEGGLHVKGVLIGNGFDDLMKGSRSQLNYWFDDVKGGKNARTIMNGASVLIEYSPSVFTQSTMPPGAEDFTTALDVYKN